MGLDNDSFMKLEKEKFNRYFLDAQQEGNEVYIGEGAAVVVYREDKCVGIQVQEGLAGLPSIVFFDFNDLYLGSQEWMRNLYSILKPENQLGLQPQLTEIIKKSYYHCALWHEEQNILPFIDDNVTF